MQYVIKNEQLCVTVAQVGAEMVSIIKDGKERLWQNPTGEWAGHAPLLFPVCGHFGVTVDGVSYPIAAHGVARRAEFKLLEYGETFIRFALESNETTKRVFPFDFIFEVVYRLEGATVYVEYHVHNPAKTPLYFACGGHETYALDEGLDGYALHFEKEETLTHHAHDEGGYLTGETVDYGTGTVFPMPYQALKNNATLIFKNVKNRQVRLAKRGGEPLADITFDGFENLLLWHAGDAQYICIEPWTNVPDAAGVPDSEFSTKAGVIKVEGESSKKLVRTITYY